MDSNYINAGICEGMSVVDYDCENLGSVDQLEGDYMVVKKGFFFPSDHYIPLAAVASVEGDRVMLSATRETALQHGWETQPIASAPTAGVDSGSGAGVSGSGSLNEDDEPFEHYQDTQHTHVNADDVIKVPLVAEELSAATREVERGSVDIHKDVVEERQSIDVPVTEEQVEITRRAVDHDVAPGEVAFEEETVDIPLRDEEVEVGKRARVREEIDISCDTVTTTERVTDTVRCEEVEVEDTGNIVADEKGNA